MTDTDFQPWATLDDIKKRWPELPPDREQQAEVLLEDATQYVLDIAPFTAASPAATRRRIICSVVQRALQSKLAGAEDTTGGLGGGFETLQMSAGPYSSTYKPLNPAGDFFLTRQEKLALGIGKQRAGSIDLLEGASYAGRNH